ncbi:hypothetical protein HYPSUDRAFT_218809 [Hypholoma sublateritium FD-334 SS-4]|uniref:Uncharacterized protein n=1 Tax=Hypholoma sublateritium (strain FD-334 SS-4) TaxID=945553 RepID=A0A0D2KS52_HYPSF|nr:hypothetical protein HYPSUDRAFT_218809 [Hypholoma sublateritium FD-334 SS-4]
MSFLCLPTPRALTRWVVKPTVIGVIVVVGATTAWPIQPARGCYSGIRPDSRSSSGPVPELIAHSVVSVYTAATLPPTLHVRTLIFHEGSFHMSMRDQFSTSVSVSVRRAVPHPNRTLLTP